MQVLKIIRKYDGNMIYILQIQFQFTDKLQIFMLIYYV